ncbi:MAG: BtpA/SgcQ family protein [Planctomycetota bacterium]
MAKRSADIFGTPKALVGMVHVAALPGTARYAGSIREICDNAVTEAKLLADAGFDAVILENMHDVPYLMREVGPEVVAGMTAATQHVIDAVSIPVGVQILAGANKAAIAVAHASGASFVRCEGFVYAAVADEGIFTPADAGPLLRYRKHIGAEHIKIIADIKKKHSSHALTADVDIAETARGAEFNGADAVIVTGTATGRPVSIQDLRAVQTATSLPVCIGSGTTPENVREMFQFADAAIVGSWYKKDGIWSGDPDSDRVEKLVKAADRARM